ncbi:MAG TPA: hypothetical protein PKD45_13685 [Flavobacteriales bacterium]|nr:hypothetical protein [Flavobacteriales bacterium]
MTIEERKIELIRWIADLKDGSMLDRMDELRRVGSETVPEGIMHLLEVSSAADPSKLVEHTTAKDLVGRK